MLPPQINFPKELAWQGRKRQTSGYHSPSSIQGSSQKFLPKKETSEKHNFHIFIY